MGLKSVDVPAGGNCSLHVARYAVLQCKKWNFDLVSAISVIRANAIRFLKIARGKQIRDSRTLDELLSIWWGCRLEGGYRPALKTATVGQSILLKWIFLTYMLTTCFCVLLLHCIQWWNQYVVSWPWGTYRFNYDMLLISGRTLSYLSSDCYWWHWWLSPFKRHYDKYSMARQLMSWW